MSDPIHLTEEQVDSIVDKAAEKAAKQAVELVMAKIYEEVGRNVARKLVWAIGLVTVALLVWLSGKGAIH